MERSELWKQRLSNWACGALTGVVGLVTGGVVLSGYRWLSGHTWGTWPATPLTFGLTFVALDLLYYWQHRAEHRFAALWAVHAVHHQSNLCDASVSLRTSVLAPLSVLTLHLLLAVAGVPFETYFPAYLLHTGLIFLLHSRTPRWLDRAGWVFNSPYLHRGHHSNHPRLRGKNLGGVFIAWDRLFGTFEPRCDDATEFGLGRRRAPLDPLRANLEPFLGRSE
jgi:sterol desaturase/sphingolipid hydroxylase (fatty acid hydroxylase superfamily)